MVDQNSELSHQRVAHPGDVVHEGQTLKLKIISLDSERHRLGLSLKQAEEAPARPAEAAGVLSLWSMGVNQSREGTATVAGGGAVLTQDFGYQPTGTVRTITGTIFNDLNTSGTPNVPAEALAGVTVTAAIDTNTLIRFWNWIKNQLNKLGFTFNDDAARFLISLSRQYVRKGTGRSEFNLSGIYKDINAALQSELSDSEVLRYSAYAPQGQATFGAPAQSAQPTLFGSGQ